MRVIDPTAITDAMLISSTAPEADYAVWAFGTFAVADRRIMTTGLHKVYECLVAHTSTDASGAPNLNLTGVTPKWQEISSTNRWKMFDEEVESQTTLASPLTLVIKPGNVNSLVLLNPVGTAASVSMKDQTGGTVVYTASKSLDGTIITDAYSYCFEPFAQLTEWVLTDLPPYTAPEITVTITGSGNVACGVLVVGNQYFLGDTEYGASAGITDYSFKSTNAFGRTNVVKRKYSKNMEVRLSIKKALVNQVHNRLASLRSTPCVWLGTDDPLLGPLVVYGFYKDFSLEIAYPTTSLCSLQIEGLT